MSNKNPYRDMLADPKFYDLNPLDIELFQTYNTETETCEPSPELFHKMFDLDSMTLLVSLSEECVQKMIDDGHIEDVMFTHWMNAKEEMFCLMEEARAEFG